MGLRIIQVKFPASLSHRVGPLLGVFFALWEGRELQLHVLHGPDPRAGGWGGRMSYPAGQTLGLAVAAKRKRAGGA